MKINNNTRIRIDRDITKEFGLPWWDKYNLKIKMSNEYDMIFTSSKNNSYYFKPLDPQKCMLFLVAYGSFVKQKAKIFRYKI